ncbi:hypothetical protein ACJJTC_001433 [Scirpophaga incertulas]
MENVTQSWNRRLCFIWRLLHFAGFRQRFTKAGRKKDYFLSKNSAWLDGIFTVNLEEPTCQPEPSTSEEKRGRPSKTYEDSSGLRARGEGEEALIVQVLTNIATRKKSEIRNSLLSEPAHLTPYTKDEALGIFIELNLSKAQYENMRSYLITKELLIVFLRISRYVKLNECVIHQILALKLQILKQK